MPLSQTLCIALGGTPLGGTPLGGMPLRAAVLLAVMTVSGCGQTGPLTLPQPSEPPPQHNPQAPRGN